MQFCAEPGRRLVAGGLPDTAGQPARVQLHVTPRRGRHCAFPGCRQKPAHCQAHHLTPRARGGATPLHNPALLCSFHRLIAVHRWGWALALHPDGTTTATSPDRRRVFHSHGPPGETAGSG